MNTHERDVELGDANLLALVPTTRRRPRMSVNGVPLGRPPGPQYEEKQRTKAARRAARKKPTGTLELDESKPLPPLKPFSPACKYCGKCLWCKDNERWDAIYKAKFENPDYYTKADVFERLRSDHLDSI